MRGVSVCIRDARGAPIAGIGIAAIRERMRMERIHELAGLLMVQKAQIERELAGKARRKKR